MCHAKPKVLVVDDERIVAATYRTILQIAGFDAVAAYSGEDAIQIASSYTPDILLSDISMGDMNGVEAAMKILESNPRCKVLFISGYVGTADVLAQARTKGFHFKALQKPVLPRELLGRISQFLAGSTSA